MQAIWKGRCQRKEMKTNQEAALKIQAIFKDYVWRKTQSGDRLKDSQGSSIFKTLSEDVGQPPRILRVRSAPPIQVSHVKSDRDADEAAEAAESSASDGELPELPRLAKSTPHIKVSHSEEPEPVCLALTSARPSRCSSPKEVMAVIVR
eukprot:TRINITY_DN79557_c0_g1_i1.p1 TRINITY_DN79557_c0_g1~~TRINITY_DN79557_c0_g1_i1.p1  ORF type:complete len:149 (-),score=34.11 TRINITY_DN79557_c0_g1_i1:181-627(-)